MRVPAKLAGNTYTKQMTVGINKVLENSKILLLKQDYTCQERMSQENQGKNQRPTRMKETIIINEVIIKEPTTQVRVF